MPALPPRRPISESTIVPSTHTTVSHQSHFSPKSNTSTSTIEPSQDSVSPPLIVDSIENVSSPISVNSNSNNNNNILTPKNHHKGNSDTQSTNNNITAENTNTKSSDGLILTNAFTQNGLRNEQQNNLLDILMNSDKCQVCTIYAQFLIKKRGNDFQKSTKNISPQEFIHYHNSMLFPTAPLSSTSTSMDVRLPTWEVLQETSARLLFMAVRWVRCLVPFQTLSKNDQQLLLQVC